MIFLRLLPIFLFLLVVGQAAPVTLPSREFTADQVRQLLAAKAALLYDTATDTFLYQRNIDVPEAPASTTKLMTALLVYERKGLSGTVTVESADTRVEPTRIPLITGETIRVADLVRALLINSDNDAAMTLARYVAGNVDDFVEMMNARAREMGCRDTRFYNPHGLPHSGMHTTARDLRRIFNQVISIPILREIAQTKSFTLQTGHGTQILTNHNRLLGRYPGMGPAKTGWTSASRHTYAAAAIRNGRELQLILLNSPDKWRDATLLFDYGFAHLPALRSGASPVSM